MIPTCAFCLRDVGETGVAPSASLEPEVQLLVLANNPWWRPEEGLCAECAEAFTEAAAQVRTLFPSLAQGHSPILPTSVRLRASDPYRGRGVTIAFLDSGFYAHPDLVEPRDRIVKYVDVTRKGAKRKDLDRPDESSWHGMMTSVVACGTGRLSGGIYEGLAPEANLVLVKCGTARRIRHDDIRRGLLWVIRNRKRYGIRIVNVSCGGDYEASYLSDRLSQVADAATREGLLVCAASGNLGHLPNHPVIPPASAPSVLTVGGVDDKNRLHATGWDMYHSSYGPTVDGLQKPEVIAPGIWVAAPILPGTPTSAQATLLSSLAAASESELRGRIEAALGVDGDLDAARELQPHLLRQLVNAKLRDNNVISEAYKHVDGTSFASPIVASLAARLLEANPALLPRQVKLIWMKTARRLPQVPMERQGWGVVDPKAAVKEALRQRAEAAAGLPTGAPRS
ncbi:MAG TPA: S8 family serine peptidase [Vicinamibacteria bacterium]